MVDEPLFWPYLTTRVGDEDSIIGLPMKLTLKLMREVGWAGSGPD